MRGGARFLAVELACCAAPQRHRCRCGTHGLHVSGKHCALGSDSVCGVMEYGSMFSVVMSFVLTLPTWKLLGNETFTFMQAMVVYIVLGIGADNIFVFSDAWKQSRAQPLSVSGSLETRFQWSWSRAMNAMSVTSLTTGCAFVLTSLADVPGMSCV